MKRFSFSVVLIDFLSFLSQCWSALSLKNGSNCGFHPKMLTDRRTARGDGADQYTEINLQEQVSADLRLSYQLTFLVIN